jgi:GNAT superfamily N-acetyltransferase
MSAPHLSPEKLVLRLANEGDHAIIWQMLQDAIEQRRKEGSRQWQDGYPNEETVRADMAKGFGHVLEFEGNAIAYAAILFEIEPAYEEIEGKWLSNGPYAVVHRVATAESMKGKGVATALFHKIEELVKARGVPSLKVDTNFDNQPMLKIMDRLGYTYCGEVYFRGSARRAFEKVAP